LGQAAQQEHGGGSEQEGTHLLKDNITP